MRSGQWIWINPAKRCQGMPGDALGIIGQTHTPLSTLAFFQKDWMSSNHYGAIHGPFLLVHVSTRYIKYSGFKYFSVSL
jgi:hypothetical protein